MIALAALLHVALATPSLPAERAEAPLLRAISLIAADRKADAYPILERLFESTASALEKERAARLLAYANDRQLTRRKRHEYAEHCLRAAAGPVTPADTSSLLRIAGDGYFDKGELEKAAALYTRLSESSDAANVDYAEYKLGWIDLNQSAPLQAFGRWQKRVAAPGSRARDLHDSLLRDLGRSWAETTPPSPEQPAAVRGLGLDGADNARLVDGVVSGLRRLKKPEHVAAFRTSLFRTDLGTAVLARILSQAVAIPLEPCSALDWLEGPVNLDSIPNKDAASALNRCFVQLRKDHPADWRSSKTRERLVAAAMRIRAVALERWMRAEFFKDVGDNALACLEFITMGIEHFEASRGALPADATESLVVTCQAAGPAKAADLEERLAALVERHAGAGLLAGDAKHPLYALVVSFQERPGFRAILRDALLARPGVFTRSLLPSLAASALSKTERAQAPGGSLLDHFAPRPIPGAGKLDAVWIELLRAQVGRRIEHGDLNGARDLIARHLPIDAALFRKRVAAAEIWLLWVLALPAPPPVSLIASAKEVLRAHLSASDEDASLEARNLIVGTALKLDELEPVWARWNTDRLRQQAAPELLIQFYQRTVDLLLDKKLSAVELEPNLVGRCLLGATRLVASGSLDPATAALPRECGACKGAPMPPFVADLRRLFELARGSGGAKLTFSSRLTRTIEGRFARLNAQIGQLNRRPWSHPTLARLARVTVGANCSRLIDELESISSPTRELQETIKDVVNLVRSWREVVLKDMRSSGRTS